MDLNKKQKESLFEALLSYAVKESAMQEIKEMPNEEQIKEKIQLSETFENKMKTLINKQRYKRIAKEVYFYSKKVAVFVAVIISISFGTLMTAEAVQQAVINTVVEWYEDYNGFIFENTSGKSDIDILEESEIKKLSYIPNGFELIESEEMAEYNIYIYGNEKGTNLVFSAEVVTDKSHTFIDNEHTDYEIIQINGKDVYLLSGKGDNYDYASAMWIDGNIVYDIESWIGVIEVIRVVKSFK